MELLHDDRISEYQLFFQKKIVLQYIHIPYRKSVLYYNTKNNQLSRLNSIIGIKCVVKMMPKKEKEKKKITPTW